MSLSDCDISSNGRYMMAIYERLARGDRPRRGDKGGLVRVLGLNDDLRCCRWSGGIGLLHVHSFGTEDDKGHGT